MKMHLLVSELYLHATVLVVVCVNDQ